jgi:hypothetical protein
MSTSDVTAVTQVVLHERQARDRGWWEQMGRCYWPDSKVRLSWYDGDGPGFVAGSEAMVNRGSITLHNISAPVVHVRGDKAYLEASAAIIAAIDLDGVRGRLTAHSRLNYRLERRGHDWRILSLDAIYEYVSLAPSIPGQVIEIPPTELEALRSSYAILSWEISRAGRTMPVDLLGDDRPDDVAGFYSGVWSWLEGGR